VKINLLKRAPGCRKSHDRPLIQSALVSTLQVSDAGPDQLLNEYDTQTNAGGDPKQAKAMRSKGSPTRLTVERDQDADAAVVVCRACSEVDVP
jgi:hypothetical protein